MKILSYLLFSVSVLFFGFSVYWSPKNDFSVLSELVPIVDITGFYHNDALYRERNLPIKRIVVHHTASSRPLSIRELYDYQHNNFNQCGFDYHYYIDRQGNITHLQDDNRLLSHAVNANNDGLAICVDGDFTIQQPTPSQVASLRSLVEQIRNKYGYLPVFGHCQIEGNVTDCPGTHLLKILSDY